MAYNYEIPMMYKESAKGIDFVPLTSELYRTRQIFLTYDVNTETMAELMKELMCLEQEAPGEEITLYINSPGGEVNAGLGVYDFIRKMKSPVRTVCIGMAASMGAILFLAGDKREMYCHTQLMIHDPANAGNGYEKPGTLFERLEKLTEIRDVLCGIIAERTGKTAGEIAEITKNDAYFKADEAVEFGLATAVI